MKNQLENLKAAHVLFSGAAKEGRFSDELNRLISAGQVSLKTESLYVETDITGASGRQNIIDENTTKIDGISSFRGNKLPKNRGVLFNKIAIAYGEGDAAKKGDVDYGKKLPAAFKNAVLGLRQRGATILERPVSDFTVSGTPQAPAEQVLELDVPAFLRDDDAIEMYFQFPNGSTVPATTTAGNSNLAQVKLWGVATDRKA